MQPFETVYVEDTVVACNGGGGALGHPRVYLNLGAGGKVECPYCSRLFVRGAKPPEDTKGPGSQVPGPADLTQPGAPIT